MAEPEQASKPRPRRRRRILLPLLGVVLVGLTTLAVLNREDEEVGPGEKIRYDDFAFAVNSFRRVKTAGSDEFAETADGVFLVIELLVHNEGPAAPFRFRPEFIEIESDAGEVFHPSERGMQALHHFPEEARSCPDQVVAGTQCFHEIVFDVPEDMHGFSVRVSLGGAFADILDLIFYGDKSIRLEG